MSRRWKTLALTIVVGALAYWLARRLVPDETRIRWQVENAIEAWNAPRAGSLVRTLAEDYRDETTGVDRQTVELWLRGLVLRKQFRHGDAFRFPAELVEGSLEIRIADETPEEADVSARIVCRDLASEDPERVVWEVEVEIHFQRTDGSWLVDRSRAETLSGRRPFR